MHTHMLILSIYSGRAIKLLASYSALDALKFIN